MASSSNDSLSAAASGAGSLASILVLSISRNRAEVSSQDLMYGKFPQMQEDFCEFLSEIRASQGQITNVHGLKGSTGTEAGSTPALVNKLFGEFS